MKTSQAERNESSLVLALRGGQHNEALGWVYQAYHTRLRALLQHKSGHLSEADHEDVLHNVFLRLNTAIQSYEPHKGGLYPWLARVVLNESRDFAARNARYLGLPEEMFSSDCLEQQVCFRVCIEKAMVQCQQAKNHAKLMECMEAVQVFAQCRSLVETAQAIGRTKGATREFLSQSRKKLAPYLLPCLTECGALLLPSEFELAEAEILYSSIG